MTLLTTVKDAESIHKRINTRHVQQLLDECIQAVVLAERERCAKVVEEFPHWLGNQGRKEIAEAIRSQSNEKSD